MLIAFGCFLLSATPAFAEPRSIDDCEAIKEADAYNLCLASFGPTRAQKVKTYPGVATGGKPGGVVARKAPRSLAGARVSTTRGGRVRMEFAPRAR